MTHTQHIGQRVLFSRTGEPSHVFEATIEGESPSGKYINMGFGRWYLATQVNILEILPPYPPGQSDQSDQSDLPPA